MAFTPQERNQDATLYVGDLDGQVDEELLWELFLQAGPIANVTMPKDKLTGQHLGYGFVEFNDEEDAEYAMKIMNMIPMFGRPLRCNKKSADRKTLDVGANLFISNLDPDVDEKMLYDTFSAFGTIISPPKIMTDPETGNPKGFAFIHFDSFESSDAAIEAMHGQFLMNRQISAQYAYKKDNQNRKTGERHGTYAERLLAAANPHRGRPKHLYSGAVGQAPTPAGPGNVPYASTMPGGRAVPPPPTGNYPPPTGPPPTGPPPSAVPPWKAGADTSTTPTPPSGPPPPITPPPTGPGSTPPWQGAPGGHMPAPPPSRPPAANLVPPWQQHQAGRGMLPPPPSGRGLPGPPPNVPPWVQAARGRGMPGPPPGSMPPPPRGLPQGQRRP